MRTYTLIRSDRKTLSLEITAQAELLVRAPRQMPRGEIERFISQKESWIEIHIKKRKLRTPDGALTNERISELKAIAKKVLPAKTAYFADIMGIQPVSVKITSAQKRLGSCSGKNGICFSYRLMLCPEAAIDYVVVHELAHIKHKNHGKRFYSLIESFMPDYKERNALLK